MCVSSDNESISGRGGTIPIIYTFGNACQSTFTLANGLCSSEDPPVHEVQPVGLAQESFRTEFYIYIYIYKKERKKKGRKSLQETKFNYELRH